MMNVFIGFEEANKYTISAFSLSSKLSLWLTHLSASENGESLGYIAEEPKGFLGILSRQMFATHRPFRAVIMDNEGIPVLWECLRLSLGPFLLSDLESNLLFPFELTGPTAFCLDKLEDARAASQGSIRIHSRC